MKLYNMLFISSLIASTLMVISSYSWFSMWMGLEINLLSFIPLMTSNKNLFSSESSLKYFITQAMASMILMMSAVTMLLSKEFINPLVNSPWVMSFNTALLMKLGAAPFHFWFPEVIEGLSWSNALIILTWQKIAPFFLLMQSNMNPTMLLIVILCCLLTSTINSFNQTSIRKILAFSSINHIAWMLTSLFTNLSLWLIYFIVYAILNLNMISVLSYYKSLYIPQLMATMNENKLIKFIFFTNLMSLGGLPPFIGFLPKWLVINWLTENSFNLLSFTLIVLTLIMLFVYLRMLMPSSTLYSLEPKIYSKFTFPFKTLNSIVLLSLPFCTTLFNFL